MNNSLPVGAIYIENFISLKDEIHIMDYLDQGEWSNNLKRRVQHFGYTYDYKSRKMDHSHKIGEVPSWMGFIRHKLIDKEYFRYPPDQVIANEYLPGQGISKHIDCEPCFDNTIASLSLLSPCEMIFRSRNHKIASIILEPRSLLIMKDDSRYNWTHEIPARKSDIINGIKHPRSRRVSLTFRTVIL